MFETRKGRSRFGLPEFGENIIDYQGASAFTRPSQAEGGDFGRIYMNLDNDTLLWASNNFDYSYSFSRSTTAWHEGQLVNPNVLRLYGLQTASPVALIEPERTNLILNSGFENGSLTPWGGGSEFATVVSTESHSGTYSVRLAKTQTGYRTIGQTVSIAEGVPISVSLWWKHTGTAAPYVRLWCKDSQGTNLTDGRWTLQNTWGNDDAQGRISLPSSAPGEWTYFTFSTLPTPVGTASVGMDIFYDGATLEEHGFLDEIQLEVGAHPSSYIPTSEATTATRDPEVLDVSDIAFPIGATGHPFTIHAAAYYSYVREATAYDTYGQGPPFGFSRTPDVGENVDAVGELEWRAGDGYGHRMRFGDSSIIDMGPQDVKTWILVSVSFDGDVARVYRDGVLLGTQTNPFVAPATSARLGGQANSSAKALAGLVAPGAPTLGIPFIDSRAWDALEISQAHTDWLSELSTIEVPQWLS